MTDALPDRKELTAFARRYVSGVAEDAPLEKLGRGWEGVLGGA